MPGLILHVYAASFDGKGYFDSNLDKVKAWVKCYKENYVEIRKFDLIKEWELLYSFIGAENMDSPGRSKIRKQRSAILKERKLRIVQPIIPTSQ
jgi:hypothetical protein